MQPSGLWPASASRSPSILQRRLGLLEVWRGASPKRPQWRGGGLGGRGAVVAEHEREGAGKVVGQEAAAVLLPDREQEEQQQPEQQQQLQGERHAAHLPAQGAEPSPPRGLQNQSGRREWARGWGLGAGTGGEGRGRPAGDVRSHTGSGLTLQLHPASVFPSVKRG